MCQFKSGIILKSRVVLAPEWNDSHSDLLESLGIEDNHLNASKTFVRAELIPKDDNKATDIKEWKYKVDQDIVPDWYEKDPGKYEQEFREAVSEYMRERITVICGMTWTKIKEDENGTYYLLDGILECSEFGKNNNYAESYIRKKLNNGNLVNKLKEKFGDRLTPISTNLLSLDGLDDYGTVEGDVLAIPTIDLYRECRKYIPKINKWWWLATPNSTSSGCGSGGVQYVYSVGDVDYCWCSGIGGVRPFFILKAERSDA